ncbi:restriction endonuclease subunit S [Oscillibacter valericigenes]|jgi:hypothetical protein ELI_1147|nr:restriction endonuclease subunit S [Oscillibacter valericigenes]
MREMKDSGIAWIGAMPWAWKMNTIAQIFLQVKCKNTGLQEKNLLSLSYGKVKRKSIDTVEGLLPESFDGYNIIEKDDIVLRLTDLQNDHTSLRVGLAEERGIITSAYLTIRNRSNFCPKYLYYYLHSFDIAKGFYGMGAGVRQGLNWDGVKWLKILAPSVPEQERIAAFLDAECAEIDAVLEKTRASIEEYKKLKQAVITQAVTKGIRGDRPMKDSGIEWIGEIANEFAVYKFKYLLKTPMQYGANEAGITFDKTLPRYIRITDITSDGRLKQDNRLCIEDTVAKPYILQDGDLLFARSGGTVGKSFLYKQSYGNAAFAGYLIRAVVNRTIAVPEYVYYYTNSSIYDTWKNSIFIQSTIQNIGADRYSNMPIIVPNNIEEQRSIVEYLNERCVGIDALIRKKQQYLTEIENYKKSLIYEYVTGKKEVV